MFFTLDTFQPLMSWLKVMELMNIACIVVTPEVSHAPMSWLNPIEPNIPCIDVTPEVSHAPMSPLKAEAWLNIACIDVTPEVSHAPMSWSKAEAL